MTEDEIKKLVQGELDQFAKNYYRRNYPNLNMTSGHISEAHGVSEYIVATDTGQSIQFYKQGNGKIVARKSLELVAGDKATNKDVSISIRAEDGHIVIEALEGDLTLRGNNVILEATDAEGAIVSKSPKVFHVKSPEIELQGTKITASSTMDTLIAAGELSLYSESGPIKQGDGTQPIIGSSVFETVFNVVDKARAFFNV